MASKIIELQNVSVVRGSKKIFSDVSFEIASGCNTAILGPNGAGKSTLLKLLTREIYPQRKSGSSLKIFGETVWNIWELRSRIGIVSNDLQSMFPPDTSGIDVVRSGFFSSIGMWRDRRLSRENEKSVREMLAFIGLEKIASRRFCTFSTGEQRRFILARALISRPEVLVLDEPTSGLDLRASILYIELLRKLMRSGTTVVLVTHNIHEIAPEIGRVVLLSAGKIVESGSTEAILCSEKLSALFEIPLDVSRLNGFYQVASAFDADCR